MEKPTQSQPVRWLTGMGSAPTVFHNPAQGVEIDGATVTPDIEIQQKLMPLTFGSFLPQKIQPIMEEIECEGEQSAVKENMEAVHRRLQFSTAGNTVQIPSAIAPSEKIGNKEEVPTMHKNGSSQMGKTLNYVPPAIREGTFIVQIEAEDTRGHAIYWSTALIRYVLGDNSYEKSMDNYITNVWNFVEKPQILYHDEGYYIFRFQNIEERDLVLQAGPYTYHNKPLILQHWSMDFKFDPGCMSVIPLWIKFSGLPLGFWSIEVLSKLASVVGKPLYTDRITAEMEKVSYARVLVEADISHPLPDSFEIQTPRGIINQQIEYDWKPKFCCECIRFGHNSNECWLKDKQEMEKEFIEQPKRKRNKNKTNLKWLPKEHRGE
ncbi:hypothetical protein A4A49_10437 [Nicotiana attenuata]|uniref:DUF4283 domain-containing protein n=1 Tax=Nicotiana attenuata TaxID=49451 RepID=A0A314LFL4_NICAT|nr:hypothetical protein A4A49_10437 [Nicotiana attenuata]